MELASFLFYLDLGFIKENVSVWGIGCNSEYHSWFYSGFRRLVLFYFFSFIFGLIGNDARRTNLRKRGFELIATLTGETPEGAIAAFFKKNDKGNRMHLGSQPRDKVD
jgi:hypothetical protein